MVLRSVFVTKVLEILYLSELLSPRLSMCHRKCARLYLQREWYLIRPVSRVSFLPVVPDFFVVIRETFINVPYYWS